jgi:predicted DNA-binding protein (MmcQ/YjbR family)
MPGVSEDFPFDEEVLAFKVMNKIFALTNIGGERFEVNLKCDPERAIELRERYPEIRPGFHMNKKHWNTVSFDESLSEALLTELVTHSYDLVVAKLTKKDKDLLNG